jgi:hypothetical protein
MEVQDIDHLGSSPASSTRLGWWKKPTEWSIRFQVHVSSGQAVKAMIPKGLASSPHS